MQGGRDWRRGGNTVGVEVWERAWPAFPQRDFGASSGACGKGLGRGRKGSGIGLERSWEIMAGKELGRGEEGAGKGLGDSWKGCVGHAGVKRFAFDRCEVIPFHVIMAMTLGSTIVRVLYPHPPSRPASVWAWHPIQTDAAPGHRSSGATQPACDKTRTHEATVAAGLKRCGTCPTPCR